MTAPVPFVLRSEHITLDALLKATGLAGSGGEAKVLIAGGGVRVNGAVETRRGRKVRGGDEVAVASCQVQVQADPNAALARPPPPGTLK
jgi:ribosome-associated protein